jgi:ribosomal protein L40E
MTDEQYQFRKVAIQERIRKDMLEAQKRLSEVIEQAANELHELEKEHRGIRAADVAYIARGTYNGNDCISCGATIPHGAAYCQECKEKHDAIEASNPLLALNLMDKKAVEAFFANPANLDNPLLERRGTDESR